MRLSTPYWAFLTPEDPQFYIGVLDAFGKRRRKLWQRLTNFFRIN